MEIIMRNLKLLALTFGLVICMTAKADECEAFKDISSEKADAIVAFTEARLNNFSGIVDRLVIQKEILKMKLQATACLVREAGEIPDLTDVKSKEEELKVLNEKIEKQIQSADESINSILNLIDNYNSGQFQESEIITADDKQEEKLVDKVEKKQPAISRKKKKR